MFIKPGEIIANLKEKNYISSGMKGADFGCGAGYFSALLSNFVGKEGVIYAIDVQEDVLNAAREFIENLKIKNVKFLRKDLEVDSGLEAKSLDFVFISQVLYQSEEPLKILKEAVRIIRPGGYVFILEPKPENILFSEQKVYDLETLNRLIKESGLEVLEIEEKGDYYLLINQRKQ